MTTRFPHPLTLLVFCVLVAAAMTWVLPAGEFDRSTDATTGRSVVVAGTYHRTDKAPVGPLAAIVAIPRGLVDAAEVVVVVLLVGGAWVVVDRLGSLGRLVALFVARSGGDPMVAVPMATVFFAMMGALENMQEELIPLVPVLLILGRRLGIDAITVVAMSAGAAMVGSAFGPTNPFQAGIAYALAQLPISGALGIRTVICVLAVGVWLAWTMARAVRMRSVEGRRDAGLDAPGPDDTQPRSGEQQATGRDFAILAFMLVPMFAYVYGAMAWDWGFNELSAGFLAGGVGAGMIGGWSLGRTSDEYLDGMKTVLSAAVMVGVARSITLVLSDGHVIDTILQAASAPLGQVSGIWTALLMLPFHALVHVAVPSVSGHAALTMPILVPLSDLIGMSRYVTVMAYQTGAGLMEMLTPTNGALMAILMAAGVPFRQWVGFAMGGTALLVIVGVVGMAVLP